MVTPRLAPAATFQHPAPLPAKPGMQMTAPGWKALPPRPALKISKLKTGKNIKSNILSLKFIFIYSTLCDMGTCCAGKN